MAQNKLAPAEDVYDVALREALKEFEELDKSDVANASLEFSLSNTSKPTDYEAWSKGSERFADDNYEAMRRWVH